MMEFTMSRVAVCACGVMMLAAALGIAAHAEDSMRHDMEGVIVKDVASMLDSFDASGLDELFLVGSEILPSASHVLRVGGNIVVLESPDGERMSYTEYVGEFELGYRDEIVLRSVPEDFRYVADGGDEGVHLLDRVVDVRGCPSAAVDPPGDVERMGAMHAGTDHDPRHAVDHHGYVMGTETVDVERDYPSALAGLRRAYEVEVAHILQTL